jgi:hypothetical protein
MEYLNADELSCNFETLAHIEKVRKVLNVICCALTNRGLMHDKSKMTRPEVEMFTQNIRLLDALTYGSADYKRALKNLGPALQHHYENNRHHPEHHENGVNDMNLIDIIEMFADWTAATLKHSDGNLGDSININEKRFDLDPQLVCIFENTIDFMENALKDG